MRACTALYLSLALMASGCSGSAPSAPSTVGDPERGRLLLRQYGCVSCHRIPGVAGARGNVGPPLEGVAQRVYLGGVLPNTPDNMVRWIRAPQAADPLTAMPNLHVPAAHAADMTAYLYRLK